MTGLAVLRQYWHLTDGQTDGQTSCDSIVGARHIVSLTYKRGNSAGGLTNQAIAR